MDKLASILTNYYVRNNIVTKDKREIYYYGFKLIIADVINYILIISLGIVFNRLMESVVFLLALCGLRQSAVDFMQKAFGCVGYQ